MDAPLRTQGRYLWTLARVDRLETRTLGSVILDPGPR